MEKLTKQLFILTVIIIGTSCSRQVENSVARECLTIKIPVEKVDKLKLSDVFEEYEAIKLEFTDNSMIQSVRKIICFEDLIYILDTFGSKAVLVFNRKGKFIRKIGESGRGPGQYILPQDFIIDKDNRRIEIIGNRNIIRYNLNGKYIQAFPINFTGLNFVKNKNGYYIAVSGVEDFKLVKTSLKGKIEKQFLPTYKHYESGVAFRCFIPQEDNRILFRPLKRDTIYSIIDKNVVPIRIFDFGKFKFKLDEYNKLPPIEQLKFMKSSKNINQCIIRNYFENKKYIHLCYKLNGELYEYIHNKKTKNYYHFNNTTITDDVIWQKDARRMVGGDNENIYYSVEPYRFHSTKNLLKFFKSFSNKDSDIEKMLNETSNPIIVFAKYKV